MIPMDTRDIQHITDDINGLFDYATGIVTAVFFMSIRATADKYKFNPETGRYTVGADTDAVAALKAGQVVKNESGRHETGTWVYLINDRDIADRGIVPKVSDRIIEDGVIYEIEKVRRSILNKVWLLTVRVH